MNYLIKFYNWLKTTPGVKYFLLGLVVGVMLCVWGHKKSPAEVKTVIVQDTSAQTKLDEQVKINESLKQQLEIAQKTVIDLQKKTTTTTHTVKRPDGTTTTDTTTTTTSDTKTTKDTKETEITQKDKTTQDQKDASSSSSTHSESKTDVVNLTPSNWLLSPYVTVPLFNGDLSIHYGGSIERRIGSLFGVDVYCGPTVFVPGHVEVGLGCTAGFH